jgi:hypothetical protein
MESLLVRKLLGMAGVLALLTACAAANNNGVPSTASSLQAASRQALIPLTTTNLSGQYSGTVKDSQMGTGKVKMLLAQSGNALGGSFVTSGSSSGMEVEIAWTESGSSVDGNSVIVAASGYCTFAMTGKYDSTTHKINGSYKSAYSCSKEHGTYTLTQKCYYQGTAGDSARPEAGVKPC